MSLIVCFISPKIDLILCVIRYVCLFSDGGMISLVSCAIVPICGSCSTSVDHLMSSDCLTGGMTNCVQTVMGRRHHHDARTPNYPIIVT